MGRFGLRDEVVSFIVDAARTHGIDELVLFGSRATGSFSNKSDIDLAFSGGHIRDFEAALEEECPTLLSFDFIDLADDIAPALRERIREEGVSLYD